MDIKETASNLVDQGKTALDADGDGKVSLDEVKAVADGAASKAKDAIDGLKDKLK